MASVSSVPRVTGRSLTIVQSDSEMSFVSPSPQWGCVGTPPV